MTCRPSEFNSGCDACLAWRDIDPDNACKVCWGSGNRMYSSTATWCGGIGGQMMTTGICDACWGSGDETRPWLDLRRRRDDGEKEIARRALSAIADSAGAKLPVTHGAIAIIVQELERMANKRGKPAAPHLPDMAYGIARVLRRAIGLEVG